MLERIIAIVALLAVASLAYWWWQRRQGRVRTVARDEGQEGLTAHRLGAPRGAHATFVQFSTPMCAKCPGTRALLQGVAAEHRNVAHVEIDASERLDLARELGIMRTPTTLVLDGNGVIVARMDGPPTAVQAGEALAAVGRSATDWSI